MRVFEPLPMTVSDGLVRKCDGVTDVQSQCLGDAQSAAVQQREERDVACLDRRIVGDIANMVGHIPGLVDQSVPGAGPGAPERSRQGVLR